MAQHENGQYIGTNLTLNEVQVGLAQDFRENLNRNSDAIVNAIDSTHNRIARERAEIEEKIEGADEQIYQDMVQIKVSSTKPEDNGVTMKVGDFWFDSSDTTAN